jgi:DNA-binding PadR family transcriptional regulator
VSAKKAAPELNATAASLLGFLQYGPMTGWELLEKVEDIIGDFWNVTRSQIYKELKVLAAAGLVETMKAGPRDKQPYRTTAAGTAAFKEWIGREPGPPTMRIPLVLSVFFGDSVPFDQLKAYAKKLRAYHAERLRTYEGFAEQAIPGTWPGESLRLGLMFQRSMIDWIDSLPEKPLRAKPRPKKR